MADALQIRRAADEWPRCGQGWPQTPVEEQAAAILAAAGNPVFLPPTKEDEAKILEFRKSDSLMKQESEAAYSRFRAARAAWKRDRRNQSAFAAMRSAEAEWKAAHEAAMRNIRAFGQEMGV